MTGERGASYPGSRGRSATSNESQSAAPRPTPLVVGPDTSVEGQVTGPGDLVVEGGLRGQVSMGGTVRLEAASRVRADIRAPRVVIVDGASFEGSVDTTGAVPSSVPAPVDDASAGPTGLSALVRRVRLRET